MAETTYVASTSNGQIDLWKLHSVIPDGTPTVTKMDGDLNAPDFDGFISFEASETGAHYFTRNFNAFNFSGKTLFFRRTGKHFPKKKQCIVRTEFTAYFQA